MKNCARSIPLMLDLHTLNPEQRACVEKIDGAVTLLAGAGTGKTRVITYRIAHMVAKGVDPERIVALSFTNKAAKEMAERVSVLCPQAKGKLNVGTFHSFCLKILREFYKEAGLYRRFGIAASADQIELVRKSLEENGWAGAYHANEIHAAISYAKNQLWDADDIEKKGKNENLSDISPRVIAQVFPIYQRQLAVHHHIDFDDCIYLLVKLLEQNPDILSELQNRFQYLLVDEFQDTNSAQLRVIELLGSKHGNVCVVGDDDQSIYSWRGARSDIMFCFEKIFEGSTLIKLEQNYRCTNIILDAANAVIKNNTLRKDKKLWSESNSNIPITLTPHLNEELESKWISERCLGLLGKGFQPKDIAILYRANNQSRSLELALRNCNLNYKIYGGQSFFERKEVKDILAYFKLILDHKDRLAFLRIINTPSRGFGLKTLEKIQTLEQKHRISAYQVLEKHSDQLPGQAKKSALGFCKKISELSAKPLTSPDDVEQLATDIIRGFHFEAYLRAHSDDERQAARKVDALRRVPAWLKTMAEYSMEDEETLNVDQMLDQLSLNDRVKEEKDSNHISLMTVHSAKGLEFPAVFVCGLEEGLFPHRNSTETRQGVDEERRLFYVALTRAKTRLFLSYARSRGGFTGQNEKRSVSRFIEEIPEELLQGGDNLAIEADESSRKKRTLGRLSKLRASLSDG